MVEVKKVFLLILLLVGLGTPACAAADALALSGVIEYLIGTSPCSNDTDVDGLSDFTETKLSYTHLSPVGTIVTAKTNAQQNDSDYDGIWDGNEVHITATRPYDCDSDEDLFSDGYELSQNSNPLNINIFPDSKTGYWGCSWWRTGGNNL